MPNWLYLLVHFAYHLGLAIWIGGAVALGALVAPALFRTLPRPQAGSIFGPTLRRFSRVRVIAMVLIVGGAAAKRFLWETHAASPWIAARWLAIAVMGVALVYELTALEPGIEARRKELTPELADDDPRRQAFNVLHRRSENLMKVSLLAALVALFFG